MKGGGGLFCIGLLAMRKILTASPFFLCFLGWCKACWLHAYFGLQAPPVGSFGVFCAIFGRGAIAHTKAFTIYHFIAMRFIRNSSWAGSVCFDMLAVFFIRRLPNDVSRGARLPAGSIAQPFKHNVLIIRL